MMTVWNVIKSDLFRYAGISSTKMFFKHFFLQSPGFTYTVFFRMVTHYSKKSLLGILGRIFYKYYTYKYGYQIPKSVKVGEGFLIMHFGHLVVNSKTVIGRNCSLYHGVTIGATFRGNSQGVPTIGDSVWIGAGSAIIGGITIGDNVLIAPNSFVNFSVPPNSVVLGNPGKIFPKEDATSGYILNELK